VQKLIACCTARLPVSFSRSMKHSCMTRRAGICGVWIHDLLAKGRQAREEARQGWRCSGGIKLNNDGAI
jgi:hypothetical protein